MLWSWPLTSTMNPIIFVIMTVQVIFKIMNVPFLDLQSYNLQFEGQFSDSYSRFIRSGSYILGEYVTDFERKWSAYCKLVSIGVGNGLMRLSFLCLLLA